MGKRTIGAAVGVILLATALCAAFGTWQFGREPSFMRVWQHEENKDVNPAVGPEKLQEDFLVDESFVTHLPLVIIDTAGREIINYKYYDKETDAMLYPEDVDVYIPMQMSVIDNENHQNSPEDMAKYESRGKLKVRGNHSAMLAKLQYRIKLLDEEGQRSVLPILGMEASDDWVLNGTQSDRSYLRTYLAMNLMGSLQEATPDVRYCELLIRQGDSYQYQGIYMFIEPVERGVGRVDISKYDPKDFQHSWILRRDRYDAGGIMLDTYLNHIPGKRAQWDLERENDGVLGIEYPNTDHITEVSASRIEAELDQFERILYSKDYSTFLGYRKYIDMDSFCDYFIMNEFLASYDAGLHSTYLYKEVGGKITIGPIWDFDGAMDNVEAALTRSDYIVMGNRPWFDQMVKDPEFVKKLNIRYRQLRTSLLSDANIEEKIDSTVSYLGRAIERDTLRWGAEYEGQLAPIPEEKSGLPVARNQGSYEKEVRRLKNFLVLHGRYMDTNLEYEARVWGEKSAPFTLLAVLCLGSFFVITILVLRSRKIS